MKLLYQGLSACAGDIRLNSWITSHTYASLNKILIKFDTETKVLESAIVVIN